MGTTLSKKTSKKTDDKLEIIKDKIRMSHDYFHDNCKYYNSFRRFLYQTTITEDDSDAMNENNTPSLSVNTTEAYVSHFLGQLSLHEPEFNFSALTDNIRSEQVKLIEAYVRFTMMDSSENVWQGESIKEAITGGFSVAMVYTEYLNDRSFDQVIKIKKIFDPTLSGFDPLARNVHKGDAKFCFFRTPMTKEDFKSKYPKVDLDNINYSEEAEDCTPTLWYESGGDGRDDIIYVCDYYEKEPIKVKLVLIANPESQNPDDRITLTDKEYESKKQEWIESGNPNPFPDIIKTRTDDTYQVMRYRLIGETMIEDPILTDYHYLPLVFLDGNSAYLGGKQVTRSYFYNAIDCQRAKNYLLSQMINDIENQNRATFSLPEDAIPSNEEYRNNLTNPQEVRGVVFYKHIDAAGNPMPGLQPLAPAPPNPQLATLYGEMSNTMQQIFGTYDAQLGIQKTELSGKAIIEGSMQSSLTSMPFVNNYIEFLSQISRIITDLIPKYYTTFRTIPVINSKGQRKSLPINIKGEADSMLKYTHNDIGVEIKPGLNIDAQKRRANETMAQLAQAFPSFAAMMQQPGALEILIDNLEIKGKEDLKEISHEFIQQQEQAKQAAAHNPPPPDPNMILAQIEQQRIQLEHQSTQARIAVDQEKVNQSRGKLLLDIFKTIRQMELDRHKENNKQAQAEYDNTLQGLQLTASMLEKEIASGEERINSAQLPQQPQAQQPMQQQQ